MFKKIAPDKWKHFFVGIVLGFIFQLPLLYWFPQHPVATTFGSLLFVSVIAYGFELFSKFTGWGVYEVMDAIASIIGGIIGIAFAWAAMGMG